MNTDWIGLSHVDMWPEIHRMHLVDCSDAFFFFSLLSGLQYRRRGSTAGSSGTVTGWKLTTVTPSPSSDQIHQYCTTAHTVRFTQSLSHFPCQGGFFSAQRGKSSLEVTSVLHFDLKIGWLWRYTKNPTHLDLQFRPWKQSIQSQHQFISAMWTTIAWRATSMEKCFWL